METIDTASKGLAYIMRHHGARFWEEDEIGRLIIHKPVPGRGGRTTRCIVPRNNVEEAEESLEDGMPPFRYVTDIECDDLTPKRSSSRRKRRGPPKRQ